MKPQILKLFVTALFAVSAFVAPATAQTSEAELLAQLQDAPESEAPRLERELMLMWGNSGSPAKDLLLERGRDALEAEDNSRAIEH